MISEQLPVHKIPAGQEALEEEALRYFIKNCPEGPTLLNEQIKHASRSRDMTGVGFYLNFEVPPDVPRLPNHNPFASARFEAEGLLYGGGFMVWVTDEGLLSSLEGYCYEDWPTESISLKNIFQFAGQRKKSNA